MTDTTNFKSQGNFYSALLLFCLFFSKDLTILKAPELPALDYEMLASSSKTQVNTSVLHTIYI